MSTNDQQFFDLAMKAIAGKANAGERTELDSLLGSHPELREEYVELQADARLAREVLPLLGRTEAQSGHLPGYARNRLLASVRRAFPRPQTGLDDGLLDVGPFVHVPRPAFCYAPPPRLKAGRVQKHALLRWWQWFGLAAAAAAALILIVPALIKLATSPVQLAPLVQLAMLDTEGATRGMAANPTAALEQTWSGSKVETFTASGELKRWLNEWPAESRQPVIKIVFDRDFAQVRVAGRWKGKPAFEKVFPVAQVRGLIPVAQEQDLPGVLEAVRGFIEEQMRP